MRNAGLSMKTAPHPVDQNFNALADCGESRDQRF